MCMSMGPWCSQRAVYIVFLTDFIANALASWHMQVINLECENPLNLWESLNTNEISSSVNYGKVT